MQKKVKVAAAVTGALLFAHGMVDAKSKYTGIKGVEPLASHITKDVDDGKKRNEYYNLLKKIHMQELTFDTKAMYKTADNDRIIIVLSDSIITVYNYDDGVTSLRRHNLGGEVKRLGKIVSSHCPDEKNPMELWLITEKGNVIIIYNPEEPTDTIQLQEIHKEKVGFEIKNVKFIEKDILLEGDKKSMLLKR
ncbi:MAG: hypothetical protein QXS93_01420 [Candidatus Micrarchaeia archaeon]